MGNKVQNVNYSQNNNQPLPNYVQSQPQINPNFQYNNNIPKQNYQQPNIPIYQPQQQQVPQVPIYNQNQPKLQSAQLPSQQLQPYPSNYQSPKNTFQYDPNKY